jgi:hypothetical protein
MIFLVIVFFIDWIWIIGIVVGIIGITLYCTTCKITLVLRFSCCSSHFVINYCWSCLILAGFLILVATGYLIETAFESSICLPWKLTWSPQAVGYARHPITIEASQAAGSTWANASEGRRAWAGTSALTWHFTTASESWGCWNRISLTQSLSIAQIIGSRPHY